MKLYPGAGQRSILRAKLLEKWPSGKHMELHIGKLLRSRVKHRNKLPRILLIAQCARVHDMQFVWRKEVGKILRRLRFLKSSDVLRQRNKWILNRNLRGVQIVRILGHASHILGKKDAEILSAKSPAFDRMDQLNNQAPWQALPLRCQHSLQIVDHGYAPHRLRQQKVQAKSKQAGWNHADRDIGLLPYSPGTSQHVDGEPRLQNHAPQRHGRGIADPRAAPKNFYSGNFGIASCRYPGWINRMGTDHRDAVTMSGERLHQVLIRFPGG